MHDCPPTAIEKVAVPAAVGVPVMTKLAVPFPFANVPSDSVAVKPLMPEDATPVPAS